MNRLFSGRSDMPFALLLLAPSLLLLGGLVAWPMVSNIEISFLRLPLNPNIESTFVGVSNYVRILSDPGFWHSLWMTVWYTALVVAGSTVLGLAVAMFFNREFRLRKTARSLVILSYVTPSISLVFAWKYMFNNGYGIVNYLGVDLLHLYEQAPLWFDNPGSSFVLVVLFAIWRYFPYAFISFLAILQTIDKSLYEAAEMDGANAWQRFRIVTLPAIMPVLATVVTLRTIWMFYMFADVYLLTTKVDILGVYLYKTAFAFNDLGKAAAISVVLFILLSILTCNFYAFYWYYKVGNRLAANAPRYGLSFQENGTSVLLWCIVGYITCGIGSYVAMYFIIKNTNALATAYNSRLYAR